MAAALLLLILQPGPIRQWLHPNLYTTAIGEQRFVELADGSSISINAQSTVRIAFSEKAREVYLNDGQALFTVAKDAARPFRVHVDNNVVQALGTKFDVWRHSGDITVAVIEGAVQVNSGLQAPRRVSAGQRVSVVANREITAPQAVNVADVSAWQQRRLVFSDSTLADIAEEFARYNRKPQIRIEGEALRARKLSAVFNADNPEGLLIFLASDHSVRFDHQGDTIVIRSTSSAPAQYSPAGPSP